MINEYNTLVDFACTIPNGVRILMKTEADLLLNGSDTLLKQFNHQNTNLESVISNHEIDLNNLKNCIDWRKAEPSQLVQHIITNFHESHRNLLPQLIELSSKVEEVHSSHEKCPNGLKKQLEKMYHELKDHMLKEEHILFPLISNGSKHMASAPIYVMQQEHLSHIDELFALSNIAYQFVAPNDACNSWRLLYQLLGDFYADLYEHIHLENNILFI